MGAPLPTNFAIQNEEVAPVSSGPPEGTSLRRGTFQLPMEMAAERARVGHASARRGQQLPGAAQQGQVGEPGLFCRRQRSLQRLGLLLQAAATTMDFGQRALQLRLDPGMIARLLDLRLGHAHQDVDAQGIATGRGAYG